VAADRAALLDQGRARLAVQLELDLDHALFGVGVGALQRDEGLARRNVDGHFFLGLQAVQKAGVGSTDVSL
jgi:hypothetical protein